MQRKYVSIAGGFSGAMAGSLIWSMHSDMGSIPVGAVIGFIAGAVISHLAVLFFKNARTLEKNSIQGDIRLNLREERLDLNRKRVAIRKVTVHKEAVKEYRNIVVPVIREELVIENKSLNDSAAGKDGIRDETIRIPVSEERIEIIKHPEAIQKVSIDLKKKQELKRIRETLKKEKVDIKNKRL